MKSFNARVAALLSRLVSLLFCRSFYPVWWQRFWMTTVPGLMPGIRGVRRERVNIPAPESGKPVSAEWLVPERADTHRALLYIHGGGFVVGSSASHRNQAARIARAAGCRALVIDYRLAPEHPFPAAVEDCRAAYLWLLEKGYRPEKMAIAGDSAGGNLTASTLVNLRDRGEPLPAAAVLISPATDLAMTGETILTKRREDPLIDLGWGGDCVGMYLAGADPRDPLASPVYADLGGLPPLLIQVGTAEVLLDDSVSFACKARAAGVDVELEEWQGMFHVFHFCAPAVRESRQAVEKIGSFLREHTR